tara:strand:- start:1273 stop:2499 length:1227 start_codon:yes stop_codon:yes gene_type:complete
MSLAIVNAKYVDPVTSMTDRRNILIQGDSIRGVGYIPDEDESALEILDCTGGLIKPLGFDFIFLADINTVTQCFFKFRRNGIGYSVILPSTQTPLTTENEIEYLKRKVDETVCIIAASAETLNDNGELKLTELSQLKSAGAKAVYIERLVHHPKLLTQVIIYLDMLGLPIVFGPLTQLSLNGAQMNQSPTSVIIGVPGEFAALETDVLTRVLDVLIDHCSVPVHFQSLSTKSSIDQITTFQQRYLGACSFGVSPFHCLFNDTHLDTYNAQLKLNPPLRSVDTQHLLAQMYSGDIRFHAPSLQSVHCLANIPKPFTQVEFNTDLVSSYWAALVHLVDSFSVDVSAFHEATSVPLAFRDVFSVPDLTLGAKASFVLLESNVMLDQTILNVSFSNASVRKMSVYIDGERLL